MKRNHTLSIAGLLLSLWMLAGCSSEPAEQPKAAEPRTQICQETISPNQDYVDREEDIVTYTVEVEQDQENRIFVTATSNSAFFEPLSYEVAGQGPITASDVTVEWTTAMGSPNQTENDQFSQCRVTLSQQGTLLDQRTIGFVNRGITILQEGIAANQPLR